MRFFYNFFHYIIFFSTYNIYMNQILVTKIKKSKKKDTRIFKFQFVLSLTISLSLIWVIFYYVSSINQKEKLSNKLIDNYNIAKLYTTTNENVDESEIDNNLFGIIEIPKINVYYPVFANLNEELLKVSPCKFYGKDLKSNGNICIAGHNYNNSKFFSNLPLLEIHDEIFVYDNFGEKYVYTIFDFYEVNSSDLTPIFNYEPMSKELTLITCNNLNSNRFVIKAKQRSHS